VALDQARGSWLSGSTSDGIALLRAAAAGEPDPAVRCPDWLARAFVGDLPIARLADSRLGVRLARGIAERRLPGAYWHEVARVKHFDRLLLEEAASGVSQVVILGAGLDSRAYRFAEKLAGIKVFEVDHPVTAARKLERVRAALGELPDRVSYVQADLSREDLADRLRQAGFDHDATVFILWCGVTMYLNLAALDSVLAWVAARPQGSSIAFDYDFEAFTAGDDRFYGAARTRRLVERGGEPLSFGLDPDGLADFLLERELTLESNMLADDLADRYLRRSDGRIAGRLFDFIGIAHARVFQVRPAK
jgi:methyltransferase (TIGR00027 family)